MNAIVASMLFFPEEQFAYLPKDFDLLAADVFLPVDHQFQLHGWYLEARAAEAVLLFLHGNAGNISIRLPKAKQWVDRGVSVFLVDYRGYGKSGGKITKGGDLYADAETAVRWLEREKGTARKDIILYGESIGSAPAIELGARDVFKAVILEAPFTNLAELARRHYGSFVPDFAVKDFEFANDSRIASLRTPLFILHGTEDEICPFEMGKRLFDQAPELKELFPVEGAHHNDISEVGGGDFYERPYQWAMKQ